ncbi:hypothetical protein CXY01_18470 [Cellulomonas xylanilytica]|uniref:Uncharacterized protein n=1 Tax=Cellulomonas xylanilytica TaxID=233583 RepID=A0A510V362_9CELL|nr:hypothetical protein CXY01_18470 [Cellulomonas xylanilytica]
MIEMVSAREHRQLFLASPHLPGGKASMAGPAINEGNYDISGRPDRLTSEKANRRAGSIRTNAPTVTCVTLRKSVPDVHHVDMSPGSLFPPGSTAACGSLRTTGRGVRALGLAAGPGALLGDLREHGDDRGEVPTMSFLPLSGTRAPRRSDEYGRLASFAGRPGPWPRNSGAQLQEMPIWPISRNHLAQAAAVNNAVHATTAV